MKNSLFILISIALLSSCNLQTLKEEKPEEESTKLFKTLEGGEVCYTIGDQYAGEFIIGDEIPKQDFLENFKIQATEITITSEGEEVVEIIYTISDHEKDLLILKPAFNNHDENTEEVIKEILVISNKYKTSFGITVGSEIEAFVSAYPDYKIWYSYVGDIYVIESEEIQAQFLLSADDFTGQIENTSDIIFLKAEDFKSGSKIQKIRLI